MVYKDRLGLEIIFFLIKQKSSKVKMQIAMMILSSLKVALKQIRVIHFLQIKGLTLKSHITNKLITT